MPELRGSERVVYCSRTMVQARARPGAAAAEARAGAAATCFRARPNAINKLRLQVELSQPNGWLDKGKGRGGAGGCGALRTAGAEVLQNAVAELVDTGCDRLEDLGEHLYSTRTRTERERGIEGQPL